MLKLKKGSAAGHGANFSARGNRVAIDTFLSGYFAGGLIENRRVRQDLAGTSLPAIAEAAAARCAEKFCSEIEKGSSPRKDRPADLSLQVEGLSWWGIVFFVTSGLANILIWLCSCGGWFLGWLRNFRPKAIEAAERTAIVPRDQAGSCPTSVGSRKTEASWPSLAATSLSSMMSMDSSCGMNGEFLDISGVKSTPS